MGPAERDLHNALNNDIGVASPTTTVNARVPESRNGRMGKKNTFYVSLRIYKSARSIVLERVATVRVLCARLSENVNDLRRSFGERYASNRKLCNIDQAAAENGIPRGTSLQQKL